MVEKIQLFPSNRRISCATPSRQRKNPTNSFSIPIVGICYRSRTSDKKPQPFSKKTPDPRARPAHRNFVDKLLGLCCTLRSSISKKPLTFWREIMLLFITSRSLCYLYFAAVAGLRFVSYSRHLVLTRGAGVSAVCIMNRQHPGLQRWRRRQPSDLEDLLLVEGLPRQQSFGERAELLTVRGQKTFGLFVALPDDLAHFGIDGFGSFLAERSSAAVTAGPV